MKSFILPVPWFYIFILLTSLPFISLGDFGGIIISFLLIFYTGIPHLYSRNQNNINLFSFIFLLLVFQGAVFFICGFSEFKYLSRGVSASLNLTSFVLLAFWLKDMYGEKAIDILVRGYVISYSVVIVLAIIIFGFYPVYESVFSIFSVGLAGMEVGQEGSECEGFLEQSHAFLLISPLLVLFYLIDYLRDKTKYKLVLGVVLFFMTLLAYKRIAIGAACLVAILFALKRFYSKSLLLLSGLVSISFLFLYVYLIKIGVIYLLAEAYGVNLMFRDRLWPAFEDYYSFDISFMGQGWDFVSKFLHENNVKLVGVEIGGLHNDILRLYIDLGFIGSIFYFATMLIFIPFRLLKKDEFEASFCWWISQIYLLFIYLTDNALIYMPCQFIVYTYTVCKLKPVLIKRNMKNNITNS